MGIWQNDVDRYSGIPEEQTANIDVVLSAWRSIRHPVAYVSMPITSGKLFYEVLESYNVNSAEELAKIDKDILYQEIIVPNIQAGVSLADSIQQRTSLPVVAPSVFEAKKQRWGQDEYMFMWFRLIEERVREMHMMDGWEYSNGGTQEFVRAIEMQFDFIRPGNGMECFPKDADVKSEHKKLRGIKVFSESGEEIRIDVGAIKISEAINDLTERGFGYTKLYESLWKLVSLGGYYRDYCTPYRHTPPYEYNFKVMKEAWKKIPHTPITELVA